MQRYGEKTEVPNKTHCKFLLFVGGDGGRHSVAAEKTKGWGRKNGVRETIKAAKARFRVMQWTDRIRQVKILLVLVAVVIAVASLVVKVSLSRPRVILSETSAAWPSASMRPSVAAGLKPFFARMLFTASWASRPAVR